MNETPQLSSGYYASNTLNLGFTPSWSTGADPAQLARDALEFVTQQNPPQSKKPIVSTSNRRLVEVFICDPNENVPLDKCLLYSGEQHLTDLTDQELFFEIDIKAILEAHNQERTKLVNKAVKERTEYLEPARVRDLKMTVVNIAQF